MIKQRCNNPKNKAYINYGGRGIKCLFDGEYAFENSLKEIGERPTINHTIERINNESHYMIGNIKWATMKEQSKNRRKSPKELDEKYVYFHKKYISFYLKENKRNYIGSFDTFEEAVARKKEMEKKYH